MNSGKAERERLHKIATREDRDLTCPGCGRVLPACATYFEKNGGFKGGLGACRECKSKRDKRSKAAR